MADYDVGEAFRLIEQELIASLRRNWEKYVDQKDFAMWQAEQLRALERFRFENPALFAERFQTINDAVVEAIRLAYSNGEHAERIRLEKVVGDGLDGLNIHAPADDSFFAVNDARLKALLDATTNDLKSAELAMLRMTDDVYRRTIFNAQVAFNTGSFSLRQAVDMATKDFLARGINCVEYANGARVGIDSYAEMALRTANKRAKVQGEAAARNDYGINTVIVGRRGVACPRCIRFCGRVFYDDVYSDLPVPDERYPRLSTAIQGGLYHPNCKDSHSTYIEGVSSAPRPPTADDVKRANRVYELEQKQRYNERQIRKYKRLAAGTLDPDTRDGYEEKVREWQAAQRALIKENEELRRDYSRERA